MRCEGQGARDKEQGAKCKGEIELELEP